MPGELTNGGEVLAALALAVQAGAIALVAGVIGWQPWRDDKTLAALLTIVVALAQAIGVALVLSMLGILSLVGTLVAHLALAAAAWWHHRHRADRDDRPGDEAVPDGSFRPWRAVATVVGITYVLVGADLSFGVPSKDNDTREYHVTNMAHWLQEGSLWDLPYQSPGGVTATHPGNGELLGSWLALPTRGDELSYAMPMAFAVLAVAAAAVLARELAVAGGRSTDIAAVGAVGGLAVLTAPLYLASQLGSLSTDIAVAAALLAALALLAVARSRSSPQLVLAAGACLGIAVGAKYTALVPGAAVTLGALAVLPRRHLWWWLVPGVAVFALPWYLRNILATGNPLFPLDLGPLPGGDTPLDIIDTPLGAHLIAGRGEILGRWFDHAARLVGPVAVLATAGCVLAFRSGPERRTRMFAVGVAVAGLVGYLATPYGGGGPTGLDFLLASAGRYALTAVLIGTVLLAAVVPVRYAGWAFVAVVGWNLWDAGDEMARTRADLGWSDRTLVLAVLAGGVIAVVLPWLRDALAGRSWPLSPVAVAVAGIAVLSFVGSATAFHRLDRGATPSPLEAALLAIGPDVPVVPLGVGDLRSLLGPRLERRLVMLTDVDEPPFADRAQVHRALLGGAGDRPVRPEARGSLADELDRALAAAPADVAVIGPLALAAYPRDWEPDRRWCPVANFEGTVVYGRAGSAVGRHCTAGG